MKTQQKVCISGFSAPLTASQAKKVVMGIVMKTAHKIKGFGVAFKDALVMAWKLYRAFKASGASIYYITHLLKVASLKDATAKIARAEKESAFKAKHGVSALSLVHACDWDADGFPIGWRKVGEKRSFICVYDAVTYVLGG